MVNNYSKNLYMLLKEPSTIAEMKEWTGQDLNLCHIGGFGSVRFKDFALETTKL
jgi:hypothetical protein